MHKKYVVTKVGYEQVVVNLTEQGARVLNDFIEWACVGDEYTVEPIDEYEAETWGGDREHL